MENKATKISLMVLAKEPNIVFIRVTLTKELRLLEMDFSISSSISISPYRFNTLEISSTGDSNLLITLSTLIFPIFWNSCVTNGMMVTIKNIKRVHRASNAKAAFIPLCNSFPRIFTFPKRSIIGLPKKEITAAMST